MIFFSSLHSEQLFIICVIYFDMKYSREYILRRAFDVFMAKGYDSASISVLQEELGMSRGAMYRYFKNKEELFIAVIDEYFFKTFGKLVKSIDPKLTLCELIELLHRRQKLYISAFMRAGVTHTVFLNYTALLIQAAKHYPGFLKRFREINNTLRQYWKGAIENSVKKNEIRSDVKVEILCSLFMNASVKESSDQDIDDSVFATSIMTEVNGRKEVLDYLYSLIKV